MDEHRQTVERGETPRPRGFEQIGVAVGEIDDEGVGREQGEHVERQWRLATMPTQRRGVDEDRGPAQLGNQGALVRPHQAQGSRRQVGREHGGALAREVASRSITVNVVAPGLIDTDMTRDISSDAQANWTSAIPLGRLGTPEDVAAAVCFLASDAAGYITGQVLAVNGGMYA